MKMIEMKIVKNKSLKIDEKYHMSFEIDRVNIAG